MGTTLSQSRSAGRFLVYSSPARAIVFRVRMDAKCKELLPLWGSLGLRLFFALCPLLFRPRAIDGYFRYNSASKASKQRGWMIRTAIVCATVWRGECRWSRDERHRGRATEALPLRRRRQWGRLAKAEVYTEGQRGEWYMPRALPCTLFVRRTCVPSVLPSIAAACCPFQFAAAADSDRGTRCECEQGAQTEAY
jgi:hypothetical protein